MLRKIPLLAILLITLAGLCRPSSAQNMGGFTGLFNTPSALMQADGTLMLGTHLWHENFGGYANLRYPALSAFATITFLPFVEAQFRYNFLIGIERGPEHTHFGDRMMSVRVRIIDGTDKAWPTLTAGFEDFASYVAFLMDAGSPSYFASNYLAATQTFSFSRFLLEATAGYGFDLRHPRMERVPAFLRQDGAFGGVALGHSRLGDSAVMLEYDSRNWNIAARARLFKHLQLLVGLHEFRYPSGGLSLKWVL